MNALNRSDPQLRCSSQDESQSLDRSSVKRSSSAPMLHLVTPMAPKKTSIRQRQNSSSEFSPSSVAVASLESGFYAPSRQKRFTFATEAVLKPQPVLQRLRGLSLEDLDHGVSICRAAFLPETDEKSHSQQKRSTASKPFKPIPVLERRLEKVNREFVEAAFEVEVNQTLINELVCEIQMLKANLRQKEMAEMGMDNLNDYVEGMKRKIRKYSAKIATLQRATTFFNEESAKMISQLDESKLLLMRRNSKDKNEQLETISEIHPATGQPRIQHAWKGEEIPTS